MKSLVEAIVLIAIGVVVSAVAVAIYAALFDILWDWLMPSLFGLREITYFEAVGVLAMAWLLFGSPFSGSTKSK